MLRLFYQKCSGIYPDETLAFDVPIEDLCKTTVAMQCWNLNWSLVEATQGRTYRQVGACRVCQ